MGIYCRGRYTLTRETHGQPTHRPARRRANQTRSSRNALHERSCIRERLSLSFRTARRLRTRDERVCHRNPPLHALIEEVAALSRWRHERRHRGAGARNSPWPPHRETHSSRREAAPPGRSAVGHAPRSRCPRLPGRTTLSRASRALLSCRRLLHLHGQHARRGRCRRPQRPRGCARIRRAGRAPPPSTRQHLLILHACPACPRRVPPARALATAPLLAVECGGLLRGRSCRWPRRRRRSRRACRRRPAAAALAATLLLLLFGTPGASPQLPSSCCIAIL